MKRVIPFIVLFLSVTCASSGPVRAEALFLQDMDFKVHPDGSEQACFSFSTGFSPHLFVLEGERPRIVVDIPAVSRWDGKARRVVSGNLAVQIRCHFHRDTGKLRIVVDLEPSLDFVVDPILDEYRHRLCLSVRRDDGRADRNSSSE
jgi:hypothetical protein